MRRTVFLFATVLSLSVPAFTGALQPHVAQASISKEATLEELVERSTVIVDAVPAEFQSRWEDIPGVGRRIVTYTRLESISAIAGTTDSTLWVRTLGGHVGNVGQIVEGEAALAIGKRSLLFLRANEGGFQEVVEMAQGHYLIDDSSADHLVRSTVHGGVVAQPGATGARARIHEHPLAEATQLIQLTWKQAGK